MMEWFIGIAPALFLAVALAFPLGCCAGLLARHWKHRRNSSVSDLPH